MEWAKTILMAEDKMFSDMQIKIEDIKMASMKLKAELRARVQREFGHVPIVKNHVWADPDWIITGSIDERVVSFLNLIDRKAVADEKSVHLFGLNNVITESDCRRKGYSFALNNKALEFMKKQDPKAYGLLFCADDLVPFYEKMSWQSFYGSVLVSQPSGKKKWPSNCMIHCLGRNETFEPKEIDLCGLPW
jgi:hypothetical protein